MAVIAAASPPNAAPEANAGGIRVCVRELSQIFNVIDPSFIRAALRGGAFLTDARQENEGVLRVVA